MSSRHFLDLGIERNIERSEDSLHRVKVAQNKNRVTRC